MANDPFAGYASPVGSTDPFAGVASPVANAQPPVPIQGAPGGMAPAAPVEQNYTAPAQPKTKVQQALDFWNGLKASITYARDVFNTPAHAISNALDQTGLTELLTNKDAADKFKAQEAQWRADKAAHGAAIATPGRILTDIAANPLTYALGPETDGSLEAVPVATTGLQAGRNLVTQMMPKTVAPVAGDTALAQVPGVLARTGKSMAIGDAVSTLDPNADYKSVGATTALSGAIPLVGGGLAKAGRALNVPSVSDILDNIGSKLGGKTPGVAAQDAANKVYNDAWDEFAKAVAPVDEQAGDVQMNYQPAIDKLKEVLGVGQKRAPLAMPDERRTVLTNLLNDLQEAGKPDGGVSNTFADAIGVVKRLGAEQRRLAVTHGDLEARGMLGDVRDSILDSMNQSNPGLSDAAKNARQVFATKVAPLFDKSEGGQFLTQLRDTPTPNDWMASTNQGSLTRMKADKAGIIAKGSSADPLLYSYLDAASKQADGKPGSFATSLQKAMPAIEQIADPETLAAMQGLVRVAKTAKFSGMVANLAASGAAGSVTPGLGAAAGIGTAFNPALSGPGIMWKILQSPATRKLLAFAGKIPEGSKELDLISNSIAKAAGVTAGSALGNTPKPTPTETPNDR